MTDGLGDANVVHSFPCTIGWSFLRVMPDGKVTSCLKSHRIPIGNLNEDRLVTLWNNEKQREFRRKTNVMEKRDPWFSNIGNDPDVACGCEKSCDDLGRNLAMRDRVAQMSRAEKMLVKQASRVLRPIASGESRRRSAEASPKTGTPSNSTAGPSPAKNRLRQGRSKPNQHRPIVPQKPRLRPRSTVATSVQLIVRPWRPANA